MSNLEVLGIKEPLSLGPHGLAGPLLPKSWNTLDLSQDGIVLLSSAGQSIWLFDQVVSLN